MAKSKKNTLNRRDLVKGLIMAIIAPVVVLLEQVITSGNLSGINYSALGLAALGGGVGYLVKNFFTNSNDEFMKKEQDNIGLDLPVFNKN